MPTITAQAQNKPSLLPNIIAFPGPRRGAGPLATLAPAPPPPWPAATLQADVLNETDLAALHRWMETAPHGYGRLHIEQSHHGHDHAQLRPALSPRQPMVELGLRPHRQRHRGLVLLQRPNPRPLPPPCRPPSPACRASPPKPKTTRQRVEVRAGIEPAFKDLQSSASPLCHRTPPAQPALIHANRPPVNPPLKSPLPLAGEGWVRVAPTQSTKPTPPHTRK